MIHRGHNCHPAEPVVVSIEGVDAPEGLAFVSALVRLMNSFCAVRVQADGNGCRLPRPSRSFPPSPQFKVCGN